MPPKSTVVPKLLLTRAGVIFPATLDEPRPDAHVRAVELELANIGYVLSSRLRARLLRCSFDELSMLRAWMLATLLEQVGGTHKHEPLFRRFPADVPSDMYELWWSKVLVHYLQSPDQPCLFCRRSGTTHVLQPCEHVVCDQCFDGTNYSACPVCEHHVDRSSPFFQESPQRPLPNERVHFKLIDLGENLDEAARAMFARLCERKQALSPADRDALVDIVNEYREQVLPWLPTEIPVRENVATIFGTLYARMDQIKALTFARRYLKTATDVLRLIAVISGTDGSLLPETIFKKITVAETPTRFAADVAKLIGSSPDAYRPKQVQLPIEVHRFKVAKFRRPVRRTLLATMEAMDANALIEDLLRHRSYWVWVGEFLHPGEYAKRFPKVARAFEVIRKNQLDGTPAPVFRTWSSKIESALATEDTAVLLDLLLERPGEFARRLDLVLRKSRKEAERARVTAAFLARLNEFATPVLLTLRNHLPQRSAPAPVRVYFPKGKVGVGASARDRRALLPAVVIDPLVRAIDAELLRRFAKQPAFATCVIDRQLQDVLVPFNERTASPAAISLPRGSRVTVSSAETLRLFMHWCEPQGNEETTDLDLSVAFYDKHWKYVDVCSFYQLKAVSRAGATMATSAGDLRDAPWPDGATEFIDLHRESAIYGGVRYAVMVVNNYSGLPFSQLERGFAGVMLRDDPNNAHFDPRIVELKFNIQGDKGVYLPLVLDVQNGVLHWLDVHTKGQLGMNNVETSRKDIARFCPELIAYFGSGVRASMFDLSLLHAAARCQRVYVRGESTDCFIRQEGESAQRFHTRLMNAIPDEKNASWSNEAGLLALLYRGDIELPQGSAVYALFRERAVVSLQASDLISG